MAVERVVLKSRIVGKGFNILDVAIAERKSDYPHSEGIDDIEERQHGVRLFLRENVVITVPWEGVAYTQGTDNKKNPPKAEEKPK